MLRHWFENVAVTCLSFVVRVMPRRTGLALGAALGHLFYLLHGRRRQLAVDNLRAAFPSRTKGECKAVLRATFGHLGRQVVELFNVEVMSGTEMMELVEVEGEERVEQARAQGRGVMYYTGHFGYWELLVMDHSLRFTPLVVVARTLDNPMLDRMLERIRTRVGTRVVPRQGAIRWLLRALLDRGSVGVMIDQHMQDRSAVTVDFFNRPAATTSAIATLALRTGAPVIPAFALPLPGGRYRMVYEAPIKPPADDDPDPVLTYTQRCTDVLEMYVRRYPELWLWMHRRWRTPASAADNTPGLSPTEGVSAVQEDAL
jgi:KDO2-lipid IV(A) lauroyltransferase